MSLTGGLPRGWQRLSADQERLQATFFSTCHRLQASTNPCTQTSSTHCMSAYIFPSLPTASASLLCLAGKPVVVIIVIIPAATSSSYSLLSKASSGLPLANQEVGNPQGGFRWVDGGPEAGGDAL